MWDARQIQLGRPFVPLHSRRQWLRTNGFLGPGVPRIRVCWIGPPINWREKGGRKKKRKRGDYLLRYRQPPWRIVLPDYYWILRGREVLFIGHAVTVCISFLFAQEILYFPLVNDVLFSGVSTYYHGAPLLVGPGRIDHRWPGTKWAKYAARRPPTHPPADGISNRISRARSFNLQWADDSSAGADLNGN